MPQTPDIFRFSLSDEEMVQRAAARAQSSHSRCSIVSTGTSESRRASRTPMIAFSTDELIHPDEETVGISSFLAACLTANYISVGYILVPWAFAQAGLVVTAVAFVIIMLQSYITCTYVMEACARAELLASISEERDWQQGFDNAPSSLSLGEKVEVDAKVPVSSRNVHRLSDTVESIESDTPECDVKQTVISASFRTTKIEGKHDGNQPLPRCSVDNNNILPKIRNRKFELPELSRIFLGRAWCLIFTATSCLDLYGLTWSVAAVFASSLAAEFSILSSVDDYVSFILIFAVVVIAISFVPIVAQVWLQMAFFAGRMVMVFIMLTTTAAAFGASDPHFGDQDGPQGTAPLANFGVLHRATQICIFSTAFQFSVPVIASISNDKSKTNLIYLGSSGYICGSVLILSLVLASYFGSDLMQKSSNINWAVYHGGTGLFDEESGQQVNVAWWATMLSKYVLIYPAIDCVSTFVLCSLSIAEIIMGAWYGDAIHDKPPSWTHQILFRLVALVPQIVGATFIRDLSVIANYAALFTIFSYTICPCLLQVFSSRIVKKACLGTTTQYNTAFSNEASAWTVALFGVLMIFYAIIGCAAIAS